MQITGKKTGNHWYRTRRKKASFACRAPDTFSWLATDASIRDHMQRCRALLFPGFEDFGIVPVEAQACGAPVIALGKGGATETIIGTESGNEATGLFFAEPSIECITNAIREFDKEKNSYSSHAARKLAMTFNQKNFEQGMLDQISKFVSGNSATKVAA
ncbi:MAG: glycosyltransferase [Planctomycetes bacterium]|nr:glycosyltransferase [Planctomycetota bacterium]